MTQNSGMQYLQISPNILNSLPRVKPPVALYHYDADLNGIRLYNEAECRLPKDKRLALDGICECGNLFLSRSEYAVFAEHISQNLGLVLTETELTPKDTAIIFHKAFTRSYAAFLDQPVIPHLEKIYGDLTILGEYYWAFPDAVKCVFPILETRHNLLNHSVNTLLVGMALYITIFKGREEELHLNDTGLGFLLHDLGMSAVPDHITLKKDKLTFKERSRVNLHHETALAILKRLKISKEPIMQCVLEHHERTDGKGYPNALKENQISLLGKICGVADSYCAMISERPYAPAVEPQKAAATVAVTPGYDKRLGKLLLALLLSPE